MKHLTDKQRCAVMQKCIDRAVKNGYFDDELKVIEIINGRIIMKGKYGEEIVETYVWLYDTDNGFAKALFGEKKTGLFNQELYLTELESMVGTDPIVYLWTWLKDKGIKI